VELNSPVLGYEDIPLLQEVIRALRHAKGRCGPEYCCGTHIHISADDYTPQQIRNLVNIFASKEEDQTVRAHIPGRHIIMGVDKKFLRDVITDTEFIFYSECSAVEVYASAAANPDIFGIFSIDKRSCSGVEFPCKRITDIPLHRVRSQQDGSRFQLKDQIGTQPYTAALIHSGRYGHCAAAGFFASIYCCLYIGVIENVKNFHHVTHLVYFRDFLICS
ncbi:MAG: amidoligase family protein, partial [Lentisphaeria bacterium]|nr:amidoligase family protein [Lentisphaeria bacterium]